MSADLVNELREAAAAQRAGAPHGATTPLADQLDRAADEITRRIECGYDRQQRLAEITADMPRWQPLTLDEQLRDRGVAMKNVPMFAVKAMDDAADEIARLRLAIRRLAEQDATLSAQGGSVTVTMDSTLTPEERRDITIAADAYADNDDDPDCERIAATLRGLLKRI